MRFMKMKKIRKSELFLLAALLLTGVILALVLLLSRQNGTWAEVRVSGQVVQRFALEENTEYTIRGVGGENRLVIQDGAAWLETADCPDELCVGMGKIRLVGQSVVCLPHEVVVEIVGGDAAADGVDLVAG